MRTVLTVLCGLALTVAVGCGPSGQWGRQGQADSPLLQEQLLAKADLQVRWSLQAELEAGERIDRLFVIDEKLYVLTTTNRLIAIDADGGYYRWIHRAAKRGKKVFRPTHADRVQVSEDVPGIEGQMSGAPLREADAFPAVFINTNSYVHMLNRDTGKLMREIAFDFSASTPGVSDGDRYYVGSITGLFRCYVLQEGLKLWKGYTGEVLSAGPQVANTMVYIAGRDAMVRAMYQSDTRESNAWERRVGGPVVAPFHVDSRAVFIPCTDNRLYAFIPRTGENFWPNKPSFLTEGPMETGVQVSARSVFQLAENDAFYAIDLVSGEQNWSHPDGRDVLAVAGGKVYLRDKDNNLLIADEVLGDVAATLPMTGIDVIARNTTHPAIWLARSDGRILCIEPKP